MGRKEGKEQNVVPGFVVISKARACRRPESSWPRSVLVSLSLTLHEGAREWVSSHTASSLRLSKDLVTIYYSTSSTQIWPSYLCSEWPIDVFSNSLSGDRQLLLFLYLPANVPLLLDAVLQGALKAILLPF